ncbi:hypothetical protein OH146_06650 [Salinibacterium sp. SYSU T00001]|uniref:hypothetical protein n=1 Tax=Homoserinimonas sedimenticola TaxID=2986805 RepID=UPI002235F788|nr:hypothetical protein [Salinibacterium sedimenticola]MCW4385448.1 hypothetical protein [Salinibacterium sedimenticola]
MSRNVWSWVIMVGGVLVVAAAVVTAIVLANAQPSDSGEDGPDASSISPTPSESAEPSASPSASAAPDEEGPETQTPVPIGEEATSPDGVTAVVTAVTPFTAQGGGVGEIGGDAVRVDVTLSNTAETEQSLGSVTINLAYGPESTPGSPIFYDPSVVEFSGMLAPGESRSGSYVFAVPAEQRDSLTVWVYHTPTSPPFVFTK